MSEHKGNFLSDRQASLGSISLDDEFDNLNINTSPRGTSSAINTGVSKSSNVSGLFLGNSHTSGVSESILPNNNFTTSELLSMKHALAVHNNNAPANPNIGRRSRSSSFYTTHTNNSNSHLNSFLNNGPVSTSEAFVTAKTSPNMSNEQRASVDGYIGSGQNLQNNSNGSNNSLYGVISSPNSTKSITAASQLINEMLNSNNNNNILQAQQRPDINQFLSVNGSVQTPSMSNFMTRSSSNAENSNSKPQLQNIITSESGLRAISENNSRFGSRTTSIAASRRGSGNPLNEDIFEHSNNSALEKISLGSIDGSYKQLKSPVGDAFETPTMESPTTPKSQKKLLSFTQDTFGSNLSSNSQGLNLSRKGSITGHSSSNLQQVSNFNSQSKSNSVPSTRYSQQPQQNQSFQNNSQGSAPIGTSKLGLFQHQQYSINEKQYLKKIKQSQQNDYYNKSIFDSSSASIEDTDSFIDHNSSDSLSDLQTPVLYRASSLKDSYFVKQPSKKLERQLIQTQQVQDTIGLGDEKLKKQPVFQVSAKGKKHRLKNKLEKASDLNYIDKIYLKELERAGQSYKHGDIHKLSFLSDDEDDHFYDSISQVSLSHNKNQQVLNERLSWQLMLTRVLTGDIVTREKSKLKDLKENNKESEMDSFKNDLWLELKSWMNGQTLKDHKKTLVLLRNSVADDVFDTIVNFKVPAGMDIPKFTEYITNIVENYEKVTSYWSNLTEMYEEKPVTNTVVFKTKVNLLHSWLNSTFMIDNLLSKLSKNVIFNEAGDDYEIKSEYIDKIVKEENVQEIFQDFYNHFSETILKLNFCLHLYESILKELDIPIDYVKLKNISKYCPKLIQKVILTRIQVANNLTNPTIMMLDQIIDDLAHYIKLATEIKTTVTSMPMMKYPESCIGIDDSIKLAISHVYEIIVLKLESKGTGLFSSTKDTDEILEHWESFRNLGCFLGEEYGFITGFMFLKLFLQLMMKLHVFAYLKFNTVPSFKNENQASEWVLNSLETFGSFERRFSRFFTSLSGSLRNQINFKTKDQKKVIDIMVDDGYTLVYTGGDLEDQGFYCFVSQELILKNGGNIDKKIILSSLNNSSICSDLVPSIDINKTLALTTFLYEFDGECDIDMEDSLEPQNKIYWEKTMKNGIVCQDLRYEDSSGQFSIVSNGVKVPTFLYEKNDGNDIRVSNFQADDYLANNANFLEGFKVTNQTGNSYTSEGIAQHTNETISNAETDLSLRISEMTLRRTGHLVLLKPQKPLLWEGNALYLETPISLNEYYMFKRTKKEYEEGNEAESQINDSDEIFISPSMKECDFIVFTEASSVSSDYVLDKIMVQFGDENLNFIDKSSSINIVEKLLRKTSKIAFNFHETIVTSYPVIAKKINKKYKGLQTLNNGYLFCRDLMKDFNGLKENYIEKKYKNKMFATMLDTAISWVSFIFYYCPPTDLETFRWCVPAMECCMNLTSNENILSLSEAQYQNMKTSVSGCMALLISHFDVMGGRARALEENKFLLSAQQKMLGKEISLDDYDDDTLLDVNSQVRMDSIKMLEKQLRKIDKQKKKIGKVLNDSFREDKYIAKLASSLSNVTIKWRKKDFVGGGSFGDVFSAINLDTGGILAVKQIKIQRSKNMEKIFPRIKDEMTVLEVLNHPNVVQYYGVEVHRDRVNIFMEYCSGGSLASLLEHGRFEDEVIIQVYSLELLEGLAYLHQSGVVHRDIKPENILLDRNGVVKYVDFGAAELVTKQGTKKIGTRSMMHSSKSIVPGANSSSKNNNDMMGTPMYMAPENITGKKKGSRLGSDDIWSLGCVILEMATGKRPWANLDNEWAIMYHVAAGHIPQFPTKDELSVGGVQFLSKMLKHNPDQRSTAVELLLDSWITEIRRIAFNTSNSNSSSSDLDTAGSTPTNGTPR
ncbi:hypothetical protein QEN19_000959 [Hanseniaspora menglaensis]